MGCISGLGRLVLIIVNTASLLIGFGLIACGAAIKYFLGDILKSKVLDKVLEIVFSLFIHGNQPPKSIQFGPLTDGLGVALMVLGCLVVAISVLGCFAGCCGFKVLLALFMVCVGVLVIGQVVVASVFLPRTSQVHDKARSSLVERLSTDYDREHISSFTVSADVLFMAAECCGVNGPQDFNHTKNLTFTDPNTNIITPLVPPSCCKREFLVKLDFMCTKHYNMSFEQGCYDRLQDLLESWYPWMIPTIILSLAVQIGVIILAVLVCLDEGNAII